MYICICKGITEKELRDKATQYNGNTSLILKSLGVGSDCGTCVKEALLTIQKELSQSHSNPTGPKDTSQ